MTAVAVWLSGCGFLPRRLLPIALATVAAVLAASAQESTNGSARIALPTNLWFAVGEELVYRVYWGAIPVGAATIKTEWAVTNGCKLLAIRYHAASNKVLSKIYPVDSRFESLIDPTTFRTVRFTRNQREGRHRYHEVTTFNYTNLTATLENRIRNTTKFIELGEDTRDLVTFLYALRAHPFREGEDRRYRVLSDDDVYDVWVRVKGNAMVELPAYGRVDCAKIEPQAAFNGIFVRKGKLTVWVSNDERRITTRVVGSIPVASINVVLAEVKGPGDDFWVRAAGAGSSGGSHARLR